MRLEQEIDRGVDPQVLEKVLGEDGLGARELEPVRDVGDDVDARQVLLVDVDPALDPRLAAADVQSQGTRRRTESRTR